MVARKVAIFIVGLMITCIPGPAIAGGNCPTSVDGGPGGYVGSVECTVAPTEDEGSDVEESDSPYSDYQSDVLCEGPGAAACIAQYGCTGEGAPVEHFGLLDGDWISLGVECGADVTGGVADPPDVTPGMVLTAFKRIGIPTYRSVAQPGDRTLVNFDTIFHAEAEPFTASVTLLGHRVDLRIRPSGYRWEFGDGSTRSTTGGGAPYPSKEIVHRYTKAHTTVGHRVVITWSATFRVNGGPWSNVPGTVTRSGPTTSLRISEATPVLSGEGH